MKITAIANWEERKNKTARKEVTPFNLDRPMAGKEMKVMKISILLIVGVAILLGACTQGEEIWSDVGRYQVIHYSVATNPGTDFYLRVDTQTGWTELFYREGDKIKYLDHFFSPDVEGKKDLKKS
jgi:hypothetical protein